MIAVVAAALRDFMAALRPKPVGLVDLHSYGQLLMTPWAHSCRRAPARAEDLIEAAYGGVRAASAVHGLDWEAGRACDVSYASPGQLVDYALGAAGIRWAFAANLRDAGVHGFLLPPAQIRPAGEEAHAMFLAIADFVRVKEKL